MLMMKGSAAMVKCSVLLLAGALLQQGAGEAVNREELQGKSFRFSWKQGEEGGFNGIATLRRDGTIAGISSPNESTWLVDGRGRLIFRHADGRISTIFDRISRRDGKIFLEGPFQLRRGIVHLLEETRKPSPENQISPEDGARIQYSRQKFIYLDPGESHRFRLRSGVERTLRLVSVRERRDSVIGLVRRADVLVEIDGRPLRLVCAPYVLPKEVAGLRVQADTTSGWLEMGKRVQLSRWDAADPLVDTSLFRFPLRNYRLFSHGIQAYNEPVHLGHLDGDPGGQRFYHNYGFDMAGYEGRDEVTSCVEGAVIGLRPRGNPSTVILEDDRGIIWEYCHLDSIHPRIQEGARVRKGQEIGILGKRGGSGNFSHLHVGTYLSRDRLLAGRMNRNLNLYPWIVAAYRKEHGEELQAVARPHQTVVTGETVYLDGSRSLSSGARITSYRWEFHDGTTAEGPRVQRVFKKPGLYMAALWVQDERGRKDVDFCKVKVFTRSHPEDAVPIIFMSHFPSGAVRAGRPAHFRFWLQGAGPRPLRVDFGDGRVLPDYDPHSEVLHRFRTPGIHIVTATCDVGDLPVTQKMKVVGQE